MRILFASFSLILLTLQGSANITWSSAATLFSSGSESGSDPELVVHPTEPTASVLWIGTGASTTVYNSDFNSGSWSSPNPISISSTTQASLQLCIDPSGIKTAVWDEVIDSDLWVVASQNTGLGWAIPSLLFPVDVPDASLYLSLSAPATGQALITWQESDHRTHGASYLSGMLSSVYYVSQEGLAIASSFITENTVLLCTSDSMLYYQTIDPSSPPVDPTNTNLFPRTVGAPMSCALDPSVNRTAFAFQDTKSLFLINAMVDNGAAPLFTTIALPLQPAVAAQNTISPIDHLPVSIWQLNSGEVRTAPFRWSWLGRANPAHCQWLASSDRCQPSEQPLRRHLDRWSHTHRAGIRIQPNELVSCNESFISWSRNHKSPNQHQCERVCLHFLVPPSLF